MIFLSYHKYMKIQILRTKRLLFISMLLISSLLSNCRLSDLRTENILSAENPSSLAASARKIYQHSLAERGGFAAFRTVRQKILIGTDKWHSTWVRWLTPVTEAQQQFQATFQTDPYELEYRFLNGKRQDEIIGVDLNGTYVLAEGKRQYEDSSRIRLYLQPLRDYFEWPFTLFESPVLLYGGKKNINGRPYELIFATTGEPSPSNDQDQFLLYINAQTGTVDYLEFTLRELASFYRGALHYREFKIVNGLTVPAVIAVCDTVEDETPVHTIELSDIRFTQ